MMRGKVCIVTGANSGIGLETVRGLAKRNATVVMVCRDRQKGEAALSDIKQDSGNSNLHLFLVNLDIQHSIRSFVDAFTSQFDQLDVLINNAGTLSPKRILTEDGLESTFATNHLSYFLLTNLLLDTLKSTPASRVINVSSDAHRSASIDFDDLQLEKRYSGYKSYARSKLANILFTRALAHRLPAGNPTVNSLHPGVVATNLATGSQSLFGFFFKLFSPFFLSPSKGAGTSLYLATSPEVEGVTGKYFENKKLQIPSIIAANDAIAARLYQISAKLTGLTKNAIDRE